LTNYIGKKEDCQFEISKEIFPNPKEHKKERGEKKGNGRKNQDREPLFLHFSPFTISPFLHTFLLNMSKDYGA